MKFILFALLNEKIVMAALPFTYSGITLLSLVVSIPKLYVSPDPENLILLHIDDPNLECINPYNNCTWLRRTLEFSNKLGYPLCVRLYAFLPHRKYSHPTPINHCRGSSRLVCFNGGRMYNTSSVYSTSAAILISNHSPYVYYDIKYKVLG